VYLFVFVVQQQFIMAVKPLIVACLLLVTYSWAYDGAQVVIDSVNSNPSAKWVAGENSFFESMSLHEIKRLVSCWKGESRRLEDVSRFPEVTANYPAPEDLPTNFSSAANWPNCPSMLQIRNQARCGSCWAFGAVESFTDRYCIGSNQQENPIMSAQYLVTCDQQDFGCQGGEAQTAWGFIQNSGLPTNSCQPYTIPTCPPEKQPCLNFVNTPQCYRSQCNGGNETGPINTKYTASKVYGVSGSGGGQQIQQEIMTNGPVEACFTVYEDFVHYKSGVYHHVSGGALGGHCVKIVGWGVQDDTPYWEVANSWTTYWGDEGYFKILRGKDSCGIEDDVVAGLAAVQ